ncbi:endonuclease domain-containing protein [Parasphingorhabdus halotolerans]|uniref:Endonuclease domain-containing protein n=1 Tax=Parasphingorhabdus halotolerans TaxID=2725558 RepID=A0A6H2DKJ6_9SPHN|nr:endonuclease domain-containing protein [Parasphingorhabdus halotolerans]
MTGYSSRTLHHARSLRREMTSQERMLWNRLRNRQLGGFKFRNQQPIGPFVGDFVCQDEKLIIEADGSQHAGSAYDQKRDARLKSRGYSILRFWNNEIDKNLQGVLEAILEALSRAPSPTSPKQ